MRIRILRPFSFAHDGHRVVAYEPGPDVVEVDESCAEVAVREAWATLEDQADGAPPREKQAAAGPPEVK